jgi:competence protein ComEA
MDWLGFSRTETNGFLILLPLMMLLIFSAPIYRLWLAHQPVNVSEDRKILDSLLALRENKTILNEVDSGEQNVQVAHQLFVFNPNSLTPSGLQKLGLSKILTTRIANYRQKGGVFRIKHDLMKIYGMDSTLYHQLYDYIDLPEKFTREKIVTVVNKKPEVKKFDINKADTVVLQKINGVGSKLAARIVKFRDALGGFVNTAQLSDVYGLDSMVVDRVNDASFIENGFQPKKLNINTTDEKTLASHPYIRKPFAKAILAYRFQHGSFVSVEDLKKIAVIPPREAERIIPYLKVTD